MQSDQIGVGEQPRTVQGRWEHENTHQSNTPRTPRTEHTVYQLPKYIRMGAGDAHLVHVYTKGSKRVPMRHSVHTYTIDMYKIIIKSRLSPIKLCPSVICLWSESLPPPLRSSSSLIITKGRGKLTDGPAGAIFWGESPKINHLSSPIGEGVSRLPCRFFGLQDRTNGILRWDIPTS